MQRNSSIGRPFAGWVVAGVATGLVACGGGSPLLHRAHPLDTGQVTVGAGLSGSVTVGSAREVIDEAHGISGTDRTVEGDEERTLIEGALADHALSPGVAPWISARVGLGEQSEAGLAYGDRRIRLDARRAWSLGDLALSLGAGASAIVIQSDNMALSADAEGGSGLHPSAFDFPAFGWGIDVPALVGVRSTGNLFDAWAGVRFGYERIFGDMELYPLGPAPEPDQGPVRQLAPAAVQQIRGEVILGLGAGSAPIFVRLETGIGLARLSGSVDFPDDSPQGGERRSFSMTALAISPGGAVVVEF